MINRESIKNIIENGGTITVSYKTAIDDWYSDLKFSMLDEGEYVIYPLWKKFSTIDDAINYFLTKAYSSSNIGYIQNRLSKKGIDFESYNLEKPNDEVKKLFKDESLIVDEEFKLLNIVNRKFPSINDAEAEINILAKSINTTNLVDMISEFKKKYMHLDPYLSLNFVYEIINDANGKSYDFKSGIDYKSFNLEVFEKMKNGKNAKYKFVELTVKLQDDKKESDYLKFKLDI